MNANFLYYLLNQNFILIFVDMEKFGVLLSKISKCSKFQHCTVPNYGLH